ncbi:MAG: phage holin family protein [Candidatus Pacebacteria bacterium]|nr:phage holin family protein [Candidatus Paceibacterota bacterium]
MIRKLFVQIISSVLGLWLAIHFIPEIGFIGQWQTLALIGGVLGLINFFIKPILKFITLPLRILTLGLFGIIINMAIIWAIDILFEELTIIGIVPLLWATLIIWGANIIVSLFCPIKTKKNN